MLKDQTLRRIARKTGHVRHDLGYELDLEHEDIKLLESRHSDPVDHAFYILMVSKHVTQSDQIVLMHIWYRLMNLSFDIYTALFQTWRERTGDKSEKVQIDTLEKALREIGRNDLLHYIGR